MPDADLHPSLSLRDELALERTRLAIECTNLRYLRAGMALVIAGLSLINFFRDYVFIWIDAFFIPLRTGCNRSGLGAVLE